MHHALFKAALPLLGLLALPLPGHAAQGMPAVTPSLKQMLLGLPLVKELKADIPAMVTALQRTPCGGALTGCFKTRSGIVQLYFFSSGTAQQTFLLVVDQSMKMPVLLNAKLQKVLGDTSLQTPIISISTTDYALDTVKMPAELQQVVRDHYFNVATLEFASGVQLAARASLGPAMRLVMASMGAVVDQLTLRAAVVMPIPTDMLGAAGAGAGLADALHHSQTLQKAGSAALSPEAYVEFQFAPNAVVSMTLPPMVLTDATFFINNELIFGYKGNASFAGATGKKVIVQFQTPLDPAGAMDLLDFQFRMATPANFSMSDGSAMVQAMASPDPRLTRYGGGFVRNIGAYKQALQGVATALSAFQMNNPYPPADYRFGDSRKPFPTDDRVFNFAILGPLTQGGPLMKGAGAMTFLGQPMGAFSVSAGTSGLHGTAVSDVGLKLGPLGKVTIQKMSAQADIDANSQLIGLTGNFLGQRVAVTLSGTSVAINVAANCVNPFEIKASATIQSTTNLAALFDAQGGANVDPATINGCLGADLQAAYRKIAGEYKTLSGYTAVAANAQLQKVADDANQAYQNTKNLARNTATNTASSVNTAFNFAGNAFKRIGKKKHSKTPGPDPRLATTVFDWDYYYDHAPDVVQAGVDLSAHWISSGFAEGRSGSLEFAATYYRDRYLDVKAQCANDLNCALQHWLNVGMDQGRQGSPDVSSVSFLRRYPDVQQLVGSTTNYSDALQNWVTLGFDAGRNATPDSAFAGPISGPIPAGGGGGTAWDDTDLCNGSYVSAFRVRAGKSVDSLQFGYAGRGYAPTHGFQSNGGYTADVALDPNDSIVRVDYAAGNQFNGVRFTTRLGKSYGPYGYGGGTNGSYTVTPGEKLGCMAGRSSTTTEQLVFSSTGPR